MLLAKKSLKKSPQNWWSSSKFALAPHILFGYNTPCMLRIRFSRTGKVGQPSYRIVVAPNSSPVKGRYLEMLGHYLPAQNPKAVTIQQDRVTYWISKGAIPTDSVAALFKKEGMANMDRYLRPRDKKRKGKQEEGEAKAAPAAAPAVKPAPAEAPKTEAPPAEAAK